jgi:hypothetical protein
VTGQRPPVQPAAGHLADPAGPVAEFEVVEPVAGHRPAPPMIGTRFSTPAGPATAGQSTRHGNSPAALSAPPGSTADTADSTADLGALADQARRLAGDLADPAGREQAAFTDGYRLGFHAGIQVGHQHARYAQDVAYTRATEWQPLHSELERRRHPGYTPARLRALRQLARARYGLPLPDHTWRSS